jgi:hypothetical protein
MSAIAAAIRRKLPSQMSVIKSEGYVKARNNVLNRLMVLVMLAVALLPICGDGSEV